MWDHDLVGSNDLIGVATLPIPSMASLAQQPAQAHAQVDLQVDLGSQILMRPQHDATGTRKVTLTLTLTLTLALALTLTLTLP